MTRKRFWGLRNALNVRLDAWSRENGMKVSGKSNRTMRPVSGRPLVNFDYSRKNGLGTSYDERRNCEAMVNLRKSLGMEG